MARYRIYHRGADAPFCYADSLEFSDKWMGECVVSVDVTSAVPLEFEIGDYIDYLGERFSIYYDTSVLKQARPKSYGGAFKYSGVKFYNCAVELKHCRFKNIVEHDGNFYSAGTDFDLHCDSVETLLERIVMNLNRNVVEKKNPWDPGYDPDAPEVHEWKYQILPNTDSASGVDINFSNISCWEALQMVFTQFKTGAYVKDYTIIVGSYVSTGEDTLRYGKGNGFVNIERAYTDEENIITRLRAYGSTKNLPTNYYSDIFEPILDFKLFPHTIGTTIGEVPDDFYKVQGIYDWLDDKSEGLYYRIIGIHTLSQDTVRPIRDLLKDPVQYDETVSIRIRFSVKLSSRQGDIVFDCDKMGNDRVGKFIGIKETTSDFYIEAKLGDFFEYNASDPELPNVKEEGTTISVKKGLPSTWIYPLKRFWRASRPVAPIGLGITRLMLPDFLKYKGTSQSNLHLVTDAYIEDTEAIRKYGIREGSVFFDNDEIGDIYPTIQGMRAEFIPESYNVRLPEGDNGRMDEILWCDNPDDNGYISNTDEGTDRKKPDWFDIYLKDIGFDILSYLSSEGSPKIQMMSGDCAGREFEFMGGAGHVERVFMYYENYTDANNKPQRRFFREKEEGDTKEYNTCPAWRIRLKRSNSGELGISFPNNMDGNKITGELKEVLRPGDIGKVWHTDQFVLLNIEMPSLYIKEASKRLEMAAREYLQEHNHAKSQYNVKLDSVFMQRDADIDEEFSLRRRLRAGTLFKFADEHIDPNGDIAREKWYIETLTIRENGDRLPEYNVTLKQDVELSTIQRMNSQIVTLRATVNSVAASIDNTTGGPNKMAAASAIIGGTSNSGTTQVGVSEEDVTKIGDGRYARLKEANTFEDENIFQGETWMTTVHGEMFATNAVDEGLEEHGAAMYDDEDGNGCILADYMTLRRAAFIRTLTIAEVQHMGGEVVLSAAACKVADVQPLPKGLVRLLFEKRANGRETHNEWKVGDQAYCKRWNAATGEMEQFYWRLVTDVTQGETDDYWAITLSGTDMAANSMSPAVNDEVVLLGHRYGGYRASAQVYSTIGEGAPSRRYYYGITDYHLTKPIELLEHTAAGAHWRVGGDTSNYIEYDGSLRIKASSVDIVSESGELNIGDVLGEHFALLQTEMEAPFDGEDFIKVLDYSAFDVSREWGDEGSLLSHVGDYLTTSDGVSYHFVVDEDNPDEPYWKICTDQYLIAAMKEAKKATKFIAGFSSENGFAKMFSKVEYINPETGEVVTKDGWAGTYVEASGDGFITGFKINTDVFVCNAANFKVDEDGNAKMNNAELNNALIHGFIYRDEIVITPDNIEDYLLDAKECYFSMSTLPSDALVLDVRKTGSNIVLQGNFGTAQFVNILLPSLFPNFSINAEQLSVVRSMVGETMHITNNTALPVRVYCVSGNDTNGYSCQQLSPQIALNNQRTAKCERTFATTRTEYYGIGDEIIYWTQVGNDVTTKYHQPNGK